MGTYMELGRFDRLRPAETSCRLASPTSPTSDPNNNWPNPDRRMHSERSSALRVTHRYLGGCADAGSLTRIRQPHTRRKLSTSSLFGNGLNEKRVEFESEFFLLRSTSSREPHRLGLSNETLPCAQLRLISGDDRSSKYSFFQTSSL